MTDWTDMTDIERVAKAIRDVEWQFSKPAPSQAYADSLPLTPMNLAAGKAALAVMEEMRTDGADQ